ncbi:MAG: uroporphyrinogen-III C-methyltransferase [Halieaceae bacterium]|nr:uroporphyrinogen-III C-methyltransferase [Halieaceae bacterium]
MSDAPKESPEDKPDEETPGSDGAGEDTASPAAEAADADSPPTPALPETAEKPENPEKLSPEPAPQAARVRRPSEADVPSSTGGRAVAILALLLALGAAGFSGWLYLQQETRRQLLDEREARLDEDVERISQTAEAARAAVADAIAASQQATTDVAARLAEERNRSAEALAEQRSALEAVEASLRSQRRQLLEISSTDRVDWTLAEAEYLLRLAYQRLLMAQDVSSALALLGSADAILRELDDTALYPAREAIAADMAALRAVPDVDVEGTWLRLKALAGRVDSLILFELPTLEEQREVVPADVGWRERLALGFEAALQKISDYLVIRRRDEPYEALMDPQWEQLVRQNLRMQIAQAQAALLAGNPTLYRSSIDATRRWLAEFFDFNAADVNALDAELAELEQVTITSDLPDIGRSLETVKDVIDARHAVREG